MDFEELVFALPVGAPKLFDSIRLSFPHSGEYFCAKISRIFSGLYGDVLHVHFITVEVGVVRRGAAKR